MKVAILAGAPGSCLAEDTELKPKTMVEIGGKPILWHILMHYAYYGHEEFVIALGAQGRGHQEIHTGLFRAQPRSERVAQNGKGLDEGRSRSRLDSGISRYWDKDGDGWADPETGAASGQ